MSRVSDIREGFSVGSRVSWGAILGGVVVAFAVYFLLNLLGTAVGLSVSGRARPEEMSVGAGIWAIVAVMLALFLGGWVASRFTIGEDRLEAVLNGAIVWGVAFLLLLWVVSVGLSMGYNAMIAASSVQGAAEGANAAPANGAQPVVIHPETAMRAAWWAFAGTVLSMLAAIGGSVLGSETMRSGAGRYVGTGRPIETGRTATE